VNAPFKSNLHRCRRHIPWWTWGIFIFLALSVHPSGATPPAGAGGHPLALIGANDALLVIAPDGAVVFSRHAARQMIPASTLKLFTSLVALHYLGPDYHFPTDFFIDAGGNLIIKGYGDPLLVSEVINRYSGDLAQNRSHVNDIVLDATYFSRPIIIPGRSASRQPFDAPNGALCANFNTVQFRKDYRGRYISAEPQTPLVPFVRQKLRALKQPAGRIVFSRRHEENVRYAGHLFRYFLTRQGVVCRGTVRTGHVRPRSDRRVRRLLSPFDLETVTGRLLEFSNNFMANQLLLAAGAAVYGPPADLAKGLAAARQFAADIGLNGFKMVEGSGISRKNRISPRDMIKVLAAFAPYRHLMRHDGREYYKTGTLAGIRTRAGYIESAHGGWYRFVVMMNTRGKSAEAVVRQLIKQLP
jgi:D-alanyl-D-alanine carboxypeptidase/D-alanyl-D-alanine-endopeptidase (penicillin-binding protein 4)